MKVKFTQGTIIENLRSKKYPNLRCKGVVISARCDLEQKKIPLFHCLIALPIEDWIFEVLFKDIIGEKKKEVFGKIKQYAQKKDLDYETLMELGIDKSEQILRKSAEENKKDKVEVEKEIASWKELDMINSSYVEKEEKRNYLHDNAKRLVEKKLQQLYNSIYPKFVFVPRKAYSDSDSSVDGLVIDLQDIVQMDIDIKEDILEYKYDFSTYSGNYKKEINKIFFFEDKDDFVIADSIIKSPWIEYVLQQFAYSFIRIGVDNANEYEAKEYCDNILEGL